MQNVGSQFPFPLVLQEEHAIEHALHTPFELVNPALQVVQ